MRPPIPSITLSRRTKIALWIVGVLVVLIIVLVQLTGVYINWVWFGSVGHHSVYSTVFWTRVVLFFVFGVLMALLLGGNVALAYRLRPPFRPMSAEQQNIERYRVMLEPRRVLILVVISAIALLSAGLSAQGNWAAWQLWLHGSSFGVPDPQFHKDISFYAWDYPVYRLMLGFGFTALLLAIVLSVVVHYLTGAIRFQTPGPKITLTARRHLTVLVFVFIVLKAIAYWLDRYGLVFSDRSKFTGASYTDVHAVLPARTILFWIALILAAGVLASLWLRSTLFPGIAFVSMLVLSILISGIYPAILQHFSVQPNASSKEALYIKRNITATRQAYGIVSAKDGGTVDYQDYPVSPTAETAALKTKSSTVSNIRILDPNVLSTTFTQQQAQQKNFYGFPPKLDVDRYTVNNSDNDYIVGVRELSQRQLAGDQTNWINQHTNYTHGWGFVAAKASENVTASNGQYADRDIPQAGPLNKAVPLTQPREYYGELLPQYSIVGAKGQPREFDGNGNQKVTYTGTGGVSLSNPLTRLAFAVNYKQTNFLLNDAASAPGAKVLINRDPRRLVEKVAPFLKVDGDPYPIVDKQTGHIVWMVDAYTTIANYPYSQRQSLSDLTSDSLTKESRTAGQPNSQINYIRNSVKATVDAYDGTVTLYQWDTQDPVLQSWMKVFPGLVKPKGSMPQSILEHVRYPEDLFEVQRSLLEQYHVDNPVTFYNVGDKWTVPTDPNANAGNQPPYYVLANPLDGAPTTSEFQLTSPMKVNNKSNLAAYISVDCEPGPDYGKMTVLTNFGDTIIPGPEQIANSFQSTDVISSYVTLQNQSGSRVTHGNLLTLPIGHSFLYVEPLYVQSSSSSSYPFLRRVLTAYHDTENIGFGANLPHALLDLQPGHTTGESVPISGSGVVPPSGGGSSSSSPPKSSSAASTPPRTGPTVVTVQELAAAQQAVQNAIASGDQVAVAKAQRQEDTLLREYLAQQSSAAASTPAPPGSGTGTPSTPAQSGSG